MKTILSFLCGDLACRYVPVVALLLAIVVVLLMIAEVMR